MELNIDWSLLIPVLAGGIRSVAGWVENSLQGNHVSFNWKLLGATILQVVILSTAAYFGLGMDITTASAVGVLGSVGVSVIKKAGKA